MSKQKLILHIGLHQTDTAFLQKTLLQNGEALKAAGVVHAGSVDPETGHHHALLQMLREKDFDGFVAAVSGLEGAVLVTSEGLCRWFERAEEAESTALIARLQEQFDLQVVLILRRQDYLRESVFAQNAVIRFQGKISNYNRYIYDFDAFLGKLETLFGKDSLAVGVYRDDVETDVVALFLQLAGIEIDPASLETSPPEPLSENRRAIALLGLMDKSRRSQFLAVRDALAEQGAITDDGGQYQMSPERRAAFLAEYLDGNKKVVERYELDCGEFFTSDAVSTDEWERMKSFTLKEIAQILDVALAAVSKKK